MLLVCCCAEVAIEEYLINSGHMTRDEVLQVQRSKGNVVQAMKKQAKAQAAVQRKRKRGMMKITNKHLIDKPEFAWLSSGAQAAGKAGAAGAKTSSVKTAGASAATGAGAGAGAGAVKR